MSQTGQRILIFGGAGFIGSNLVEHIKNTSNSEIVVYDNLSMGNQLSVDKDIKLIEADMGSQHQVEAILKDFMPTRVYHFVANSDIAASSSNPILDIDNTLGTTVTLIQALTAIKYQIKEMVFASSSAVYAPSESLLDESSNTLPISSYGWMKLVSERQLELAYQRGLIGKLLIARFPNVTGRNQTHGVVRDLIKKLTLNPSKLDVLGDGWQDKPYVLASELVLALEHIINQEWNGKITLNLGPETTSTVRDIVRIINKVSGFDPEVRYGNTPHGWQGDVPKYKLNTNFAKNTFNLVPFSSSEKAISESVEWAWNAFNK